MCVRAYRIVYFKTMVLSKLFFHVQKITKIQMTYYNRINIILK